MELNRLLCLILLAFCLFSSGFLSAASHDSDAVPEAAWHSTTAQQPFLIDCEEDESLQQTVLRPLKHLATLSQDQPLVDLVRQGDETPAVNFDHSRLTFDSTQLEKFLLDNDELDKKILEQLSKNGYPELFCLLDNCSTEPHQLDIDPSWIDLPHGKKYETLTTTHFNSKKFDRLNLWVDLYHKVNKSDIKKIVLRINLLNTIGAYVQKWENEEGDASLKNFLFTLNEMIFSKKLYLECIKKIEHFRLDNYSNFEDRFLNKKLVKEKWKVLFLSNYRYYNTDLKEYWGEYWLEAIDPCHRHLTSYKETWDRMLISQPGTPSFFLWLETQNIPSSIVSVCFLDDKTREFFKVIVKKERLYRLKNKKDFVLIDTQQFHEFIFIIDETEEIIAAEGDKKIKHISLSSGKPVLGAGYIKCHNGIIMELGCDSGHYFPKREHVFQTIEIFRQKGIFLKEDITLIYYENFKKQTTTLGHFLMGE